MIMRIFSRNKKKSQYSTVCQSMLDSRYGFRTESYEGSGVRDALDIVFFECNDMGNYDIPKTMLSLYGGTGDDWQNLRWWVEACEKGDDPLEYIASGDLYNSLARILENELPIGVRYALWLTTEDAVREYYGGEDGDIDRYSLDDAIVLSDLGYDGVLFGFERMPTPIQSAMSYNKKIYHGSDVPV